MASYDKITDYISEKEVYFIAQSYQTVCNEQNNITYSGDSSNSFGERAKSQKDIASKSVKR
jgi:hypothetical protein